MSDEQFERVFNELQARGDKAKLMQSLWSPTGICTGFVLPYYFSSRSDSDYSREAVSPPTRPSEPEVKTVVQIRLWETRRYALARAVKQTHQNLIRNLVAHNAAPFSTDALG